MIPKAYIDAWASTEAPWQEDTQVEQDLIISRILVELFQSEFLREHIAFRGGTALHKLFFSSQVRYSEDIDLVQIIEAPIKPILNEIAEQLSFLGSKDDRNVEPSSHSWTAYYSYDTENPPPPTMNIKIEINPRAY